MSCLAMNMAMCILQLELEVDLFINTSLLRSYFMDQTRITDLSEQSTTSRKPQTVRSQDRQKVGTVGFHDIVCWSNKWRVTLAMNPGQLPCSLT